MDAVTRRPCPERQLFNFSVHYGLVLLLLVEIVFFRLYGATARRTCRRRTSSRLSATRPWGASSRWPHWYR